MRWIYYVSVSLHILAACLWIGGALFLALVVVPVTRRGPLQEAAPELIGRMGLRFRKVGWTALIVLVVTGVLSLYLRGYGWAEMFDGTLFSGSFGWILGHKLVVVGAILLFSLLHDFWIGPRALTVWKDDPDSREARRLRRRAGWFGRLNLLLALLALLLGVMLVRG